MRNRKRLLNAGRLVFLLLIIGLATYYITNNYIEDRRELVKAPNIIVHSPTDGDIVWAESSLDFRVSASGIVPISRVEMWLDGELESSVSQASRNEDASLNLTASFQASLSEGSHLLFWRAVDDRGLIGQTGLFTLIARHPASIQTSLIRAEKDQTLEDIANKEGADLGVLSELNPGLNLDPLTEGTEVIVTSPPNDSEDSEPPPDNSIPASLPLPPPLPDSPSGISPLLPVSGQFVQINLWVAALTSSVPTYPTDLQVGFANCKVKIVWRDNSEEETHFRIWMQRLGGPPRIISTLPGSPATGPAWTEFDAPAFGIYSFWVEALTGVGGQPSEMVGVAINDADCAQDALATRLEIEALDLRIFSNIDRFYCYISFEDRAERRIPESEDQFIDINSGWGDILQHWGGNKRILLLIPEDKEILLEGECFGWAGTDSLTSLGKFEARVSEDEWDGRRLEISADGFTLGYRIQLQGASQANGVFHYTDYSILQPHILAVSKDLPEGLDLLQNERIARRPTIHWFWNGDPSTITGFQILLDGNVFQWADSDLRTTRLLLPAGCGRNYRLQVVANSGDAQSVPSEVFTYETPDCPIVAEVEFISILADSTDDTGFEIPLELRPFGGNCHKLSIYGFIWASSPGTFRQRRVGSENILLPFTCGFEYAFEDLAAGDYTFFIPISPLSPSLKFGTKFFEHDFFPSDDWGVAIGTTGALTNEEWQNYEQEFSLTAPDPDDTATGVVVKVRVKGIALTP